jgi:hypothetical protein
LSRVARHACRRALQTFLTLSVFEAALASSPGGLGDACGNVNRVAKFSVDRCGQGETHREAGSKKNIEPATHFAL